MLNKADVAEVTGIAPNTLQDWVTNGLIESAERAERKGMGGHRFSFVQAVALAYANNWRGCGAGPQMVREVVECVTAHDEDGLRAALAAGRRLVWPGVGGRALIAAPEGVEVPRLLDLADVYQIVSDRIAHIEKVRGRKGATAEA